MATHENPPADAAPTLLGITEGDGISIGLADGNSLLGIVKRMERDPVGTYFDAPGRYEIHFQSSGVGFELEMYYRDAGPTVVAESSDLRIVEGTNWTFPIAADIERIERR